MSQVKTQTVQYTCDRCGAESDNPNGTWGSIQAQNGSGTSLLGALYKADLCTACSTSLTAWFGAAVQVQGQGPSS